MRKYFLAGRSHPYNSQITRTGVTDLIPVEIAREIIQGVPAYSTVMQVATRGADMSTKQRRVPVLSTLPTAYFVNGDTGLKQTTQMEWSNLYFDVEEMAVIVPIPEAVLDDSTYDIWGEVKPRIMEAFGVCFDAAVLFGTNAPASWPTNIYDAAVAANKIVTLGTGVDLYEDLLGEDGTISLVEEGGNMANGHISSTTMRGRLRGLRDANGQPLFKTGIQGSTNYELDGAPLFFPKNGALDETKALMFSGDFKKILYCMRQDVTYKILDQAVIQDGAGQIVYNLAQQDMVALRAVMRLAWQRPNPITREQSVAAKRFPISILKPAT